MDEKKNGRGTVGRFQEIALILARHHLEKGLTPEKLRAIFEALGPTYVKLGQIISTRSDLLPSAYCQELTKLRSDAAPMPLETVREVIETEYHRPCDAVFPQIDPEPLGSASIAQAHLAALPDGRQVVIKVQRPGIYDTMRRDITLLKKAAKVARFTPVGDAVDFSMVLDEMWTTAQEEMNFRTEALNLREFARKNRDVPYVGCPQVIDELVTRHILVLEYVDGLSPDDPDALIRAGCDPGKIAGQLAENFIKQVLDDRFFHADPHPGNLRIRDGKIIWLDLGMMGRLSEMDGALFTGCIRAVAENDAEAVTDVVLGMGVYRETPDRALLVTDVEVLLSKYRQMSLSAINVGRVTEEFLSLARKHMISMPPGMTMFARSVVILESVLTKLNPETNLLKILSAHIKKGMLDPDALRDATEKAARQLKNSMEKLTAIPGQLSDALSRQLSGRAAFNINIAGQERELREKEAQSRRMAAAVIAAAMIVAGALLSPAEASGPAGLSWPSVFLFAGALALSIFALKRAR